MTLRMRVWVGRQRLRLVVAGVLIGVVGGLAMGIAAGTRPHPGASAPVLVVAAIAVAALVVANALALLPARRAARVRIAPLSLDR